MGWGRCGKDSKGREIGYLVEATCDHPGCDRKIHRGRAYACGGDHGTAECYCEKYYCAWHRVNWVVDKEGALIFVVCDDCRERLLATREWVLSEETGALVRASLPPEARVQGAERLRKLRNHEEEQ